MQMQHLQAAAHLHVKLDPKLLGQTYWQHVFRQNSSQQIHASSCMCDKLVNMLIKLELL